MGMTVSGVALKPPCSEPVTPGIGGGLLPTPTASSWKGVGKVGSKSSKTFAKKGYLTGVINETCSPPNGEPTHLNPSFLEQMMGYEIGYTELKH
tara:strand:+ start:184 stop:465 length:282 start_codon:yes stop_codon:yes gene_type:complete